MSRGARGRYRSREVSRGGSLRSDRDRRDRRLAAALPARRSWTALCRRRPIALRWSMMGARGVTASLTSMFEKWRASSASLGRQGRRSHDDRQRELHRAGRSAVCGKPARCLGDRRQSAAVAARARPNSRSQRRTPALLHRRLFRRKRPLMRRVSVPRYGTSVRSRQIGVSALNHATAARAGRSRCRQAGRGADLHVRHDRHAEGRDADPSQTCCSAPRPRRDLRKLDARTTRSMSCCRSRTSSAFRCWS